MYKLNNKCLNCGKTFYREDHYRTREPKFCCKECFYKYYHKVCISCGNETLPHHKRYKRKCILCAKEDKNAINREYYDRKRKANYKYEL